MSSSNDLFAAIDVGTNTVRMLIQSAQGQREKFLTTTRIGESSAATGVLRMDAMIRSRDAVAAFVRHARASGVCAPVWCYATSAVREANNGGEFLQMLQAIEGLSAEILSGEQEAWIAYLGAARGREAVVMDIGGGSTELIHGSGKGILGSCSVRLGCVESLETYLPQDPPTAAQLSAFAAHAIEQARVLCDTALGAHVPDTVLAIGGTATQLAMLKQKTPRYQPGILQGVTLNAVEMTAIYQTLCLVPRQERACIPGMDNDRADVILPGCRIALAVLNASGATHLTVCDDDGLDGYLYGKMQTNA